MPKHVVAEVSSVCCASLAPSPSFNNRTSRPLGFDLISATVDFGPGLSTGTPSLRVAVTDQGFECPSLCGRPEGSGCTRELGV